MKHPCGLAILVLAAATITAGCSPGRSDAQDAVQEPSVETFVIPDGTRVIASLDTQLATDTNHSGDSFTATTVAAIFVDGNTVVPAGAQIRGILHDVQASGRTSGRAQMTLTYETIVDSQGETRAISALPLPLQAASATGGDIEKIAAGTVLGAIIGGVAGGGTGAIIGAGAGAGAGTILMLATKGDDLELTPGQQLAVHLTGPTSVQALAQR